MHERTKAALLKVKRAKQHIADLDSRIHGFFTGPPDPYPIIRETEPETGDFVIKLGKCAPIPEDFPLIIGDILQNLRTALDHLVHHLVLSNGGTPTAETCFPISKSQAKYKPDANRKIKGMDQEAIKMIDALRPYAGGNEDLVGLHLLNNADKHRLLLICGAAHIGTKCSFELSSTPQMVTMPMNFAVTYPLKEGTELYRLSKNIDGKVDKNPQFTFRIAFGDAEIMRGEPMLPPLHQLADLVHAIIVAFDRFQR